MPSGARGAGAAGASAAGGGDFRGPVSFHWGATAVSTAWRRPQRWPFWGLASRPWIEGRPTREPGLALIQAGAAEKGAGAYPDRCFTKARFGVCSREPLPYPRRGPLSSHRRRPRRPGPAALRASPRLLPAARVPLCQVREVLVRAAGGPGALAGAAVPDGAA